MGGKSSSAPPPDPKLVAAQLKSMGIQDDAIQKIVANSDEMMPLQKQQMQFGLDTAKTAYDQSQQDRQWSLGRRDKLTNAQDSFSNKVDNFDTEAKREELAGQAEGDVNQAFSNAKDQETRAQQRMGVNPNSGRALATGNAMAIAQASGLAGASSMARRQATEMGFNLESQKANMLSGYPTMASGLTTSGAGLGASGLGIANTALAGINSGYGAGAGVAGAMGGNAANMFGQEASYKNSQDQIASSSNPMNTILGAAAGMGSAYALKKIGG